MSTSIRREASRNTDTRFETLLTGASVMGPSALRPRAAVSRTNTLGPAYLGISLWFLLCLVLPLSVTFQTDGSRTGVLGLFIQFLIPVYAGTKIVMLLVQGTPRWLEFIFWVFSYIWLGLAGLAQESSGKNPYLVALPESDWLYASVIVLVGMVCYDIGIRLGRSRVGFPSSRARLLNPNKVLVVLALAPAVTLILIHLTGGFGSLFVPRSTRSAELAQSGLFSSSPQATEGVLTSLLISIPLVAAVSSIHVMYFRSDLRKKLIWKFLSGANIALCLIVGNPVSNPRFWTGTILLSLIFSLPIANTAPGFRIVGLLVLTGLLTVFPYADYFRYVGVHTNFQSLRDLMISKGDYDAPIQIATAVEFRSATGGTSGHQILGVLGFFVPRTFWPDKPGGTGALLSHFVNFSQSNVSSPLWIEAYVDGGLVALVLAFLTLGVAVSGLERHGFNSMAAVNWHYPLTALVAGYSLLVLRGSLLTSVGPLFTLVLFLFVMTNRAPQSR